MCQFIINSLVSKGQSTELSVKVHSEGLFQIKLLQKLSKNSSREGSEEKNVDLQNFVSKPSTLTSKCNTKKVSQTMVKLYCRISGGNITAFQNLKDRRKGTEALFTNELHAEDNKYKLHKEGFQHQLKKNL